MNRVNFIIAHLIILYRKPTGVCVFVFIFIVEFIVSSKTFWFILAHSWEVEKAL